MPPILALLVYTLVAVAARGTEFPGDQVRGPRLTDRDFFAALDLTRPALGQVAAAVAGGDLARAKAELLAYYRARPESGGARGPASGPTRRKTLAGGADQLERFCARVDGRLDRGGCRFVQTCSRGGTSQPSALKQPRRARSGNVQEDFICVVSVVCSSVADRSLGFWRPPVQPIPRHDGVVNPA